MSPDLLQRAILLLAIVEEFDRQCEESSYTDTSVVWELLTDTKILLLEIVEAETSR